MDKLWLYTSTLAKGLPVTISLSVSAIIVACGLAILLTILLTSQKAVLTSIIRGYILVFTGTPLLVQIFLIYYGLARFEAIRDHLPLLWDLFSRPWFCAFLALALNSAAYTTLIFHGALKAVPDGHWQACAALGMNQRQTLKVVLPYALKRALSSYSNEVIFVVKGTALASTITLMDLMAYNQFLNGRYYEFSIFIITGAIYLLINGFLSIIMRIIEKKALAFESQ
ncbi:arginine ABC transporter permease ArtM [Zophobihabitans entericus]|uniref:Arginine ABC transporter permease protein ArtM n=1 Tax=Zophobihabitans entericus TaxID=1635327 RepID=A0A6G9ID06_9GAMM|nr:arginine ABC transporter permease ArtM [Zophobihabitans entericus]QIQ22118.1 arginine ABC transporter permease ArtM [Zophobihabitans entericus]